jgi:hypothetical protein
MDEGRRWAIETFGANGVYVRERVSLEVRAEHIASADAQEASGHRSLGVYGEFWRGILERFEAFGKLPGATLFRPGEAPYNIPVINGVAMFPWRYGRSRDRELASTPFTTSPAREAMFDLGGLELQGEFDLGVRRPELTDEEQELVNLVEKARESEIVTSGKLVVVAISSSPSGLHEVRWGDVSLTSDGCLTFGFSESLLNLKAAAAPKPYAVPDGDWTFTSGDLPEKNIGLPGDEDDEITSDDSSDG